MTELMLELLEIMDEECSECEEWKKNRPIIINIYVEVDE